MILSSFPLKEALWASLIFPHFKLFVIRHSYMQVTFDTITCCGEDIIIDYLIHNCKSICPSLMITVFFYKPKSLDSSNTPCFDFDWLVLKSSTTRLSIIIQYARAKLCSACNVCHFKGAILKEQLRNFVYNQDRF